MSKNTSSEIKLTPTAPAALPALKGLNLRGLRDDRRHRRHYAVFHTGLPMAPT